MDNLHVNSELAATIVEDEDADAAAAGLERIVKARPQVGLVNDGKALLNISRLSHGDNVTILHVEDAILLEYGTQHCLHNNARGGIRDKRRLLVQLPAKQINSEVTVLPRRRRGGDADDLAGPSLEHHKVANANVVARNGNSVGEVRFALTAARTRRTCRCRRGAIMDLHVNVLVAATGVDNLVRKLVDAMADGVVVA